MIGKARQEKTNAAHVPSWLKASIIEAAGRYPGTRDYTGVGYAVGKRLDDILRGLGDSKYRTTIKEWDGLGLNETGVLKKWCRKWISHVMRLIPYARQELFVRGIRNARDEGEITFEGGY